VSGGWLYFFLYFYIGDKQQANITTASIRATLDSSETLTPPPKKTASDVLKEIQFSWWERRNGLAYGVSFLIALKIQRNKHAVSWVVTPCSSCKNRRVGGTCRLHHQDGKNH
jgi:hypothetical protein